MAKKKRRLQAPSLSALDRGIYYSLIACSLVAALFLYPVIIGRFRQSVFEDTHILAQNNPGMVILCVWGLFAGGGFGLGLDWLRRKKQPIFGKSNVRYGPPQWKPVYPLFSKRFWSNLASRKKLLATVIICAVVFLLSVGASILLGLPPRECLYDDGSIRVYNCLNVCTDRYSSSDVEEISIFTRTYYNRGGPDDWGIVIKMSMNDGEDFFFSYNDFQTLDDNIRGCLTGINQVKACFDSQIIMIDGEENLPYVVQDMNLNEHEIEQLYLLFDTE